jgi:hypothetical protein
MSSKATNLAAVRLQRVLRLHASSSKGERRALAWGLALFAVLMWLLKIAILDPVLLI